MYKDIVMALQSEGLMQSIDLKAKVGINSNWPVNVVVVLLLEGEPSFFNDSLIYRTELTNGKDFTEIREYQSACGYYLVQYYFVTRFIYFIVITFFSVLSKIFYYL